MKPLSSYWRPDSRTWWLGAFNVLLGLTLAVSQNLDMTQFIARVIDDLTGSIGPYLLTVGGLALITGRSAVRDL